MNLTGRKVSDMPQPSYAYAVARIRALENLLVDTEKAERIIASASVTDAIKVLSDTGFGVAVSSNDSVLGYEAFLKAETKSTAAFIKDISPSPELTNLFLLKNDFHNLKVLFKTRILNIDGDYLLVDAGVVPIETLKSAVVSNNYISLPPFMKAASEEIEAMISVKADPQKIDLKLDRAMFAHIASECKRLNNAFVSGYFERLIDLTNIRTLVRVKKMGESIELLKEALIPYGSYPFSFYAKALDEPYERLLESLSYSRYDDVINAGIQEFLKSSSLALFEKLADDHLLRYIKSNKHNPFGIEPIVGYLAAKEGEIRLVRTVMVALANNVSHDRIRERLRELYV
jgi:V/A-type H+-transporting ATPase subunit C